MSLSTSISISNQCRLYVTSSQYVECQTSPDQPQSPSTRLVSPTLSFPKFPVPRRLIGRLIRQPHHNTACNFGQNSDERPRTRLQDIDFDLCAHLKISNLCELVPRPGSKPVLFHKGTSCGDLRNSDGSSEQRARAAHFPYIPIIKPERQLDTMVVDGLPRTTSSCK